jgi:hypothetical protein
MDRRSFLRTLGCVPFLGLFLAADAKDSVVPGGRTRFSREEIPGAHPDDAKIIFDPNITPDERDLMALIARTRFAYKELSRSEAVPSDKQADAFPKVSTAVFLHWLPWPVAGRLDLARTFAMPPIKLAFMVNTGDPKEAEADQDSAQQGWNTLRFTADEIHTNPEAVVDQIDAYILKHIKRLHITEIASLNRTRTIWWHTARENCSYEEFRKTRLIDSARGRLGAWLGS